METDQYHSDTQHAVHSEQGGITVQGGFSRAIDHDKQHGLQSRLCELD